MTSSFVYKVMELTFNGRINTQLIYRFELAQMVAWRITKPQRIFFKVRISLAALFIQFFFFFRGGGGGGGGVGGLFYYSLHVLFFSFYLFLLFFILLPLLTCIMHIYMYKISVTTVTTQTTVNSEIYANSVKRHICDVKIRD